MTVSRSSEQKKKPCRIVSFTLAIIYVGLSELNTRIESPTLAVEKYRGIIFQYII